MARPRRIAVYGGSFNPPHVGHAMVAAWLGWTDHADTVVVVPTWDHPFAKDLAPFDDRLAWCEALASSVGPWVEVSDIERTLGGTSYTRRTLDALAAAWPDATLRLVLGADLVPTTPRWRDWDVIADRYNPLVIGRGGFPPVDGAPTFPAVSSTAVREAWARGEDVSAWVPAAVLSAMRGR